MNDKKTEKLNILFERIFAHAHTGLAFSNSAYDVTRYREILSTLDKLATLLTKDDQALADALTYLKSRRTNIGNQEYVTPKVAVVTVIFNPSGEVLLVKRDEELWALPGGYADIGLGPIQNAEKEVREETGLEVKVESLIGVYDSNISEFPTVGRQTYALVFYASLLGGNIRADPVETQGVSFFNLNSLPNMPLVTRSQIERGFQIFQGEPLPIIIDN